MTTTTDIVTALTDLYTTLSTLTYLPATAILRAPTPEGWTLAPPIPTKSASVLSLMRQLPYLSDTRGFRWLIAPSDTSPLNYSPRSAYDSPSDAADPMCILSQGGAPYIPSTCLPLTNGDESGTWLILDTEPEEWTITSWIPAEAEEVEGPAPGATEWRRYATRPAVEVLRGWTRRFQELEWVPLRSGGGLEVLHTEKTGEAGRERYEAVRGLYLEHGWPERFDAEGFRVALREWLGEGSDDEDDDEESEEEDDDDEEE